jgi:hypothetical protein
LLYRGSRDGFAASTFHGKCDGQSNTVTIIESTRGYVFGGFTPIAWDSGKTRYKSDGSGKSFLYTIKNPRGTGFRKFSLTNSSKAIYCLSSHGPVFGSNCDIAVTDGSNANATSHTHLGGAYANDTGYNDRQVFTGEYNFTAKEIEVFTLDT